MPKQVIELRSCCQLGWLQKPEILGTGFSVVGRLRTGYPVPVSVPSISQFASM